MYVDNMNVEYFSLDQCGRLTDIAMPRAFFFITEEKSSNLLPTMTVIILYFQPLSQHNITLTPVHKHHSQPFVANRQT